MVDISVTGNPESYRIAGYFMYESVDTPLHASDEDVELAKKKLATSRSTARREIRT